MVEVRSAYELQRDKNVERNNEWLVAHGLLGGLVPTKPTKPLKPAKRKADDVDLVPTRASSRHSKKVVLFEQLDDDYFEQHEPDSDDERKKSHAEVNSKRKRTKAVYFQPSMCEGVARRTTARSTKPIRPATDAALESVKSSTVESSLRLLAQAASTPKLKIGGCASVSAAPIQFTDNASVKPYFAAGKKGQCPRCLDWFCIRRDGMLHTHHCRQVHPKQPVAPFLPAV